VQTGTGHNAAAAVACSDRVPRSRRTSVEVSDDRVVTGSNNSVSDCGRRNGDERRRRRRRWRSGNRTGRRSVNFRCRHRWRLKTSGGLDHNRRRGRWYHGWEER